MKSSNKSSQNLPKRRLKEIFEDFGFDLKRLAHGGGNFCTGQKVYGKWKESFCMPQESFEKLNTKLRPYIQKNKGF